MSKLFFTKFGLIDQTMPDSWARLKSASALSAEQLAELNWRRRTALVRFCAECIPFYQRTFKAIDFSPEDLKSNRDFERLPILEKEEIREFTDEIVSSDFDLNQLPTATTGGTTGAPLKVYMDPRVHLSSMSWRMLEWWGLSPADNSGYLYRAIPDGLNKLKIDIALFPTRRSYIAAADMTNDSMERFYEKILRSRAKYLVGYVGAIDEFARYLDRTNRKLAELFGVWTTSAPLPATKRIYYEHIFSCPVYTQYGSCEFYWIAAECQQQSGMHIGSDIRHVDIVEGAQPVESGQFGDIVVTDLLNYAFPLLRYRVGDRGRLLDKQCACGLPFPMMDYVKGRVSDSIRLMDGTAIPGEYWTTIFDDFTETIRAFQVLQKADYSLQISYEVYEGVDATIAIDTVNSRIGEKLKDRIPLSFMECDISANDNGKLRFVVSELS